MPYPMMQWPTFSEFRERLVSECGCEYKELADSLVAIGDGEPCRVNYLERKLDGIARTYAVVIPDDERVTPSAIRSICSRLGVDPALFGLTLG